MQFRKFLLTIILLVLFLKINVSTAQTPTLQQVTTAGATTTNAVTLEGEANIKNNVSLF